MDDGEDEPVDLLEQIRGLLVQRERWQSYTGATPEGRNFRAQVARRMVVTSMRIARLLCGPDVIATAFERQEGDDRAMTLKAIASRLDMLAFFFMDVDGGAGTFDEVIAELRSIASGDAPALFSQMGARRRKDRLNRSKFDAIRWDAYLDGLGLSVPERHAAIETAFGKRDAWDTVSRWKAMATDLWGSAAVERRLMLDRLDGKRQLRRWTMKPNETWQEGLTRAGERHREIERQ